MSDIYSDKYVKDLFDKMSKTYGRVNHITSFGFNERWRKQMVKQLSIQPHSVVLDLFTGMGECWPYLLKESNNNCHIIGLDFSEGMLDNARRNKSKYPKASIEIIQENIFSNSIDDDSVDYVCCAFGLKTFTLEQWELLSKELKRIVRKGGCISFIDISVPSIPVFKSIYLFYIKFVIPFFGMLLLGNIDSYKLLGVYAERFGNSEKVLEVFKGQGFNLSYLKFFFGCATGFVGLKK